MDKGLPFPIFSVVARETKGILYIEAEKEVHVREVVNFTVFLFLFL